MNDGLLDQNEHSITFAPQNSSAVERDDLSGEALRLLASDIAFLTHYGYHTHTLAAVMARAQRHGVEAHEEMIASGEISAKAYYRCLADHLSLDFVTASDLGVIQLTQTKGIVHALRYSAQILHRDKENRLILVTAPKREEIERLRLRLAQYRGLNQRIAIAEVGEIRRAYRAQFNRTLSRHAADTLYRRMPGFSAYRVATLGIVAGVLGILVLMGLLALTPTSILSLFLNGVVATLFFLSVSLRLAAAITLKSNKRRLVSFPDLDPASLPVYSVLVAAYDEANIIGALIDTLAKLDWPAAKLDIKIILEVDDRPTIDAAQAAIAGRSNVELVLVPPGDPRTKPRALNYALPLARGDFLVIYDAEDRPHPGQLKAAYHRFWTAGEKVHCIQAPLLVDNANHTFLSAMFELEYAGLFDGLIPALARWRLPVLLGGTSNHFRTKTLRAVGAWDPYNVTEDADLGIRLTRFGYRVEAIDLPTYEEAPAQFIVWLKQRSRWFKGWMQTSLVHMRRPAMTLAQLSAPGFFTFHLISTTLLASALGYPFFTILLAYHIYRAAGAQGAPGIALLLGLNLAFAFLVYTFLAFRALSYRGKRSRTWYALGLPVYWFFLSIAAWRALGQLIVAPHIWEKTVHGKVLRARLPWHLPIKPKPGK